MQILILEKFNRPTTTRYQTEGEKMGHHVTLANYKEVVVNLNKEITIQVKGQDLTNFDAIYLRTLSGREEIATLIAKYAKLHRIAVFDQVLENGLSWIDSKSYELFELSRHGLPIVPSVVAVGETGLSTNTSYPLIIKRGALNQGKGVFLCKTKEEAQKVVEEYNDEVLVFEPFLPNDGDLRVIVIGSKPLAAIKRSSNDPEEFRNNVSLGGSAEEYPLNDELSKLAVLAAKAVGYDIAGVDLIFDQKSQQWSVMEVNRSPQYKGFEACTNIDVVQEIMKFLTKTNG